MSEAINPLTRPCFLCRYSLQYSLTTGRLRRHLAWTRVSCSEGVCSFQSVVAFAWYHNMISVLEGLRPSAASSCLHLQKRGTRGVLTSSSHTRLQRSRQRWVVPPPGTHPVAVLGLPTNIPPPPPPLPKAPGRHADMQARVLHPEDRSSGETHQELKGPQKFSFRRDSVCPSACGEGEPSASCSIAISSVLCCSVPFIRYARPVERNVLPWCCEGKGVVATGHCSGSCWPLLAAREGWAAQRNVNTCLS